MSTQKKILVFIWLSVLLFLGACAAEEQESNPRNTSTEYVPVYLTRAQLNQSVKITSPRPILQAGKIRRTDAYLFVNEDFKGVHIIQNSDPTNPRKVAFVEAPACTDFELHGNYLYVSNAVDMVVLDIQDPSQPAITHREEDVFPQGKFLAPPDGGLFNYDPSQGYIVDWIK